MHISGPFSSSLTLCLPDLPPLVAEFIHCLVDVSHDPKIVPGIQWALKNIRRMHEQTFLLLHLKCLCYIINLILHLLLSRFITFSQRVHCSFLNIFSFFAQYYVSPTLVSVCAPCNFMFLAFKEYIGLCHLHSDGWYCCSGFS